MLNLLCGSHLNPKLSAWAQLHGPVDFNWIPIALPGIWVLVHEKPVYEVHGHPMLLMDGTLAQHYNPTDATQYGYGTPEPNKFATPSLGFYQSHHANS